MAAREHRQFVVATTEPMLSWLRLFVVAIVGSALVFVGTGQTDVRLAWGVVFLSVLYAASNSFLGLYKRFRKLLTHRVYAAIDLLLISALVALTGGANSPLYMLYALPLVVAVLSYGMRAGAWLCVALSLAYGLTATYASHPFTYTWVAHLGIFWGMYLLLGYVTYTEEDREEKARRRDELGAMHSAAAAPVHTGDIPTVIEKILMGALGATHSHKVSIFLYDETDDRFTSCHSLSLDGEDSVVTDDQIRIAASDVLYTALYTGATLPISDLNSDRRFKDSIIRRDRIRSAIVAPLTSGSKRVGVFCFGREETHRYTQHDTRFADTLAKQASVAIHTAVLFEEAASVEAAKEADKLRSQLLATVSHELRTPIAAIQGFASSLRCASDLDIPKEMEQDWIWEIESNAERLRKLVTDLLDLSRLEAGALRMKLEWQDIRDVLDDLRANIEIIAGSRKVIIQIQDSLPLVKCDSERIGQVVNNLVENATKFSPPDSTIVIGAERFRDGLRIGVLDEGEGIAPEFQERIFERFYQVEGKSPGTHGGTGLGLAICRNIIEAHGGQIWVESSPGKGSIFYVSLPAPSTVN